MTRISPQLRSRRSLLSTAARLSATLALAPLINPPPVHAAGNDIIRLGLIGCGGRGVGTTRDALSASPITKIVAVGDLFMDRVNSARKALSNDPNRAELPENHCFTGFDAYKKVIESDVDVIILATPPGFRARHFEAAIRAGKHVFMEKPAAVDAPGARRILAASQLAQKSGLKVGAGYQRRHESRYVESIKQLQAGANGKIDKLEAYWKSAGIWTRARKPGQTEMEYQVSNWIHFVWLSGDMIVECHTHNLDVCNWLMGTHPTSATGTGSQQGKAADRGDCFDNFAVRFVYPDGTILTSECGYIFQNNARVGEYVITGPRAVSIPSVFKAANPQNPYVQEWADLLTAITDNKPYNEADDAIQTALTGIMGRMAAYTEKEVTWDMAAGSDESFEPLKYEMTAPPPTAPDNNGTYPTPAKGRRTFFA